MMIPKLTTKYLGMTLKNPLVASAGPLTGDLNNLRRLEDAGASAAVFPSLFEEQIEHDEMEIHKFYEFQALSNAESLNYFPEMPDFGSQGPDEYLDKLRLAKEALSIPVMGSLNGWSDGGWIRYAKAIEQTGVDALELNVYFVPTDPTLTAAQIEQQYIDLVETVRDSISIPLAVKLGPNFSSLPNFAQRLAEAGADGLVLFNRYLEADINLETLEYHPDLILSNRHEARTPIRWIGILRDQLDISLAATSGVHRTDGIIKLLLAGADITMMTSILLMKGPEFIGTLLEEVTQWLIEYECTSVEQLKGSMSQGNCPNPSALERANYMRALKSYTTSS